MFLGLGQGIFIDAQIKTYLVDESLSEITFKIKHMGVLTVEGQFQNIEGTIVFDANELVRLESKIAVNSINTSNKSRDETLIEESYLNSKAYPEIIFYSERIEKNEIMGKLSLRGVTKIINLPFTIEFVDDNQFRIVIASTIARDYFDLKFGSMDNLIGNEIKVDLKIAMKLN